jgi:hypothetical protein
MGWVKYFAPKDRALYDLVNSAYGKNVSDFVSKLNEEDFSDLGGSKNKLWSSREYIAIAGTHADDWMGGAGAWLQSYFTKFQASPDDVTRLKCDGLVPVMSAAYPELWKKACSYRAIFVDTNHSDLVGTRGIVNGKETLHSEVKEVLNKIFTHMWGTNHYMGTIGSRPVGKPTPLN